MRERGELPDGRGYGVYEVMGQPVRVLDSFSSAMRCSKALEDRVLGHCGLIEVLLGLLACDPEGFCSKFGTRTTQALVSVMEQAFGWDFGGDAEGGDAEGGGVIDWDADEARVRVTMRMAYGLGREFERLPYREVVDLVFMAPADTPMGRAVYYRVAEPPEDSEAREEFERMREHYALGDVGEGRDNEAATGMFESMRSMADGS